MNLGKTISLIILLLAFILVIPINASKASEISNQSHFLIAQADSNSELGKEFYIENCGTCHIPLPAEVLPTNTWQNILEQPQDHYGESLPNMVNITVRLIWSYLRSYSRPTLEGEVTPEFVTNSRYFKALHPLVDLPRPVSYQSCKLCHTATATMDYRLLTPEWDEE
ncbi:Dihem cytochrome c [Xenococcus sp. PCC 7305]|uniref:dihem cytochrome c n=1 Tax=Xenococcus sp. PCC 7305 TaxID=102125 RepID=UPI0002AC5D58|nr:dihem cytochrome c [Xenococcus sp. PCC 7305]ELS04110.1 Dihem cytochrome c [Xenococcus sp. PCC 7305]